jgi:hypothetical protein
MSVASTGGRKERFFGGQQVAQWRQDADEFELEVEHRLGPYHRKLGLLAEYQYVYKRISDRLLFQSPSGTLSGFAFPEDSLYHQINLGIDFTYRRFLVVKRINGFDYNEDFDAGAEFGMKLGRAFVSGFDDHLYDYAEFEALATRQIAGHIITGLYKRSFWFRRDVDFRRLTEAQVIVYNNSLNWVTLALRTLYVSDRGRDPFPFDLGGKTGLRGYDTEFQSGDRAHVINFEARFFPNVELWSVKLGTAAFADLGRTFTGDERFTLHNYYVSAGAGLRLSFERWTRSELARIDVAMTRGGEWHVSVGTGQYF